MTLAVEVAGQTDVGCVRTNNEDNFGYDARYGIFVVCDGMGGQAAGEVASKMAVDVLLEYFRAAAHPAQEEPAATEQAENPGIAAERAVEAAEPGASGKRNDAGESAGAEESAVIAESAESAATEESGSADETSELPVFTPDSSLADAIHLANRKIYEAGQRESGRSGMGSTIVAALLRGNALSIAHVGDSRIYLIRHGEIQQLTQDHSWVMEQVRAGLITREQAETSEMQNVILRALGSEAEVQADVEDLPALNGDLLLMTSDGLTRHVRDREILEIVSAAPSLGAACGMLIQTAKDRGGEDNITCLLLKMVERPWYRNVFNKLFSGGPQWQNSI